MEGSWEVQVLAGLMIFLMHNSQLKITIFWHQVLSISFDHQLLLMSSKPSSPRHCQCLPFFLWFLSLFWWFPFLGCCQDIQCYYIQPLSTTIFLQGIPKYNTVRLAPPSHSHSHTLTLTLNAKNPILILAPPAHTHTQHHHTHTPFFILTLRKSLPKNVSTKTVRLECGSTQNMKWIMDK